MIAPVIQFNDADHSYVVNGRPVPSVTEVLKPLYGDLRFVGADLLEYKSDVGRAVHRAIELHLLGGLVYSSLSGPVADLFDGFMLFEAESGFCASGCEHKVASALGYAGTLDGTGWVKGGKREAVFDWKTTAVISPAVGLQLAAYERAVNEVSAGDAKDRYALRLMPGGRYRLVPFTAASDFGVFMGLLQLHRWCKANNKSIDLQGVAQ